MSGAFHFDFSVPIQSVPSVPSIPTTSIMSNAEKSAFVPTDVTTESRLENCEVIFQFNDEGYTLINILKEYLAKMPEVQFVGRRQHNKVDTEMYLRIKLDRKWVNENHRTVESAMRDCLRRATRKAIDDAVSLRNSIPNVPVRTVTYDESQSGPSQSGPSQPPQFETFFDPSEFAF